MPQARELINILRPYSPAQIASLMKISDPLAALNAGRFTAWMQECTTENAKQAVLAYSGDVYQGLDASCMTARQFDWLQSHLRILSGLYGVLRPLDLIQPYRLEMGIKLQNGQGKDLYAYWKARITQALAEVLAQQKERVLINLASEEYFKAVDVMQLGVPVITPVFQDWSGGKYRIVSLFAKRARGMMTRFAAVNGITKVDQLREFDSDGYAFDDAASKEAVWVFRREKQAA